MQIMQLKREHFYVTSLRLLVKRRVSAAIWSVTRVYLSHQEVGSQFNEKIWISMITKIGLNDSVLFESSPQTRSCYAYSWCNVCFPRRRIKVEGMQGTSLYPSYHGGIVTIRIFGLVARKTGKIAENVVRFTAPLAL